jgi:predicted Zn finger-like uncharacterized protein
MILTCPTCASRYFVDETKLGPQGRTVRCANCGDSWRAEREIEPLELTPAHTLTPATDADEPSTAKPAAEVLPKAFRQKAEAKRRTQKAVAAGIVWAAMSGSAAIILITAVVFRVQVVRLWPRTAGAYAAVRLPVNPFGVAPDNVQAAPGLENGRAALIVTGAERNVDSRPRPPATMKISVYDKAGAAVMSRIIHLSPEPLGGGESRPFKVSFLDPPINASQVGVDFILDQPPAPAPKRARVPTLRGASGLITSATTTVVTPHLRGPVDQISSTPTAATAVPSNSPYALPTAARSQKE